MGVLGGTLSECYSRRGACSGHGSFHSPYPAIHMASLCRLDLDEAIGDFGEVKVIRVVKGLGVLDGMSCPYVFLLGGGSSLMGMGCGATSPTLVWWVVLVVPK